MLLRRITNVNRFVRDRFVWVLLAGVGLGVLAPRSGLWLKELKLQGGYDFPNLALGLMMLSASVQCELRDFRQIVARPRAGALALVVLYVVVPLLAAAIGAYGARFVPEELQEQLQVGLMMSALMPVAMTSSVWVRLNGGSLALLLALIILTTALSVATVPLYLTALVGISGAGVAVPTSTVVEQLVMSVTLPSVLGLILRATWSRWVDRWTPLFSLLGNIALVGAVLVNMAVAAPHLDRHGSAIAVMSAMAVGLALIAFVTGLGAARFLGLAREDSVTLLFASGMRSNSTGLVLALKSFPHMPLVCVPAAVYMIAQHLMGATLTRTMERAKSRLLGPSIALEPRSLKSYLDRVLPHSEGGAFTLIVFRMGGAPPPVVSRGMRSLVRQLRRCLRVTDFLCVMPPDRFGVVLLDASEKGQELVRARVRRELGRIAPGLELDSGLAQASHRVGSGEQLIRSASVAVEDTVAH
ncbi:MAG: bile acid:sodium symporter family protein [Myxococcaceae bacterium]